MQEITRARSLDVMPSLQRLIDENIFAVWAEAGVLVVDRRLFGPSEDADEASIFTLIPGKSDDLDGRPGNWRIGSEYETENKSILPTVALLGGRPGSNLLKPLVVMMDIANIDLAPFLQEMSKIRQRFSSIEVLIFTSIDEECYGRAALREYLNEGRIIIRALMLGRVELVSEEQRLDIQPSSISTVHFATSLGRFLHDLAVGAPKNCERRVATLRLHLDDAHYSAAKGPFFTVLTRTQGKRSHTLRDVFCCLAAQTCMDFEHLVVCHDLSDAARLELDNLVASQVDSIKSRVRLSHVRGGNRTKPLNCGFREARGLYAVILDDDDIVMANWLEVFRDLAIEHPGRLLRATAVKQEFEQVTVNGRIAARAVSGMSHEFGGTFNHVQHLVENRTPPVSIAFPTFVFKEIGFEFDETLTTTEDWDYIMRCAGLVDVACSNEITSIYRWWVSALSSRTDHQQSEWAENHELIHRKMDSRPYLTPTNSTRNMRELSGSLSKVEHDSQALRADLTLFKQALDTGVMRIVHDTLPTNDLLDELIPLLDLSREQEDGKSRVELKRLAAARSGLFDAEYYLATNPDVREAGMDPLKHFADYGCTELRSPGPSFDPLFYYVSNPDIREKRVDPFYHYIGYGKGERRLPRSRPL